MQLLIGGLCVVLCFSCERICECETREESFCTLLDNILSGKDMEQCIKQLPCLISLFDHDNQIYMYRPIYIDIIICALSMP